VARANDGDPSGPQCREARRLGGAVKAALSCLPRSMARMVSAAVVIILQALWGARR
jgi:hypothetical protein